jgi:hypothetical protein
MSQIKHGGFMITLKLQIVMAFILCTLILTSCASVPSKEEKTDNDSVVKKQQVRISDRGM